MNEVKIVGTELLQEAVEGKENNGGGYEHTRTVFEFQGKQGVFEDTSCGDFGSRFFMEWDGKMAMWGSMIDEELEYSEFDEQEQSELLKHFSVPVFEETI